MDKKWSANLVVPGTIMRVQFQYWKIKKNHVINLEKKNECCLISFDKNITYQKKNGSDDRENINDCIGNRSKTVVNFRLILNKKRRIPHALKSKSESTSTRTILGTDIESCPK